MWLVFEGANLFLAYQIIVSSLMPEDWYGKQAVQRQDTLRLAAGGCLPRDCFLLDY